MTEEIERFKKMRERLGLTWRATAPLFAVSVRTVARWESGATRMPAMTKLMMEMLEGAFKRGAHQVLVGDVELWFLSRKLAAVYVRALLLAGGRPVLVPKDAAMREL